MAPSRPRRSFDHALSVLSLLACLGACSGSQPGPSTADGGRDSGQSGGSLASGGSGTGGTTPLGGAPGTGGGPASGGTLGTGGVASGGNTGSGGKSGPGGATGSGGSGASTGEYGFTYRSVQGEQLDWLCTFHAAGPAAYAYVQLDKTGMKSVGIATVPVYTAKLAQVSVDGAVSDLAGAQYDYGGGHHNDSLQFNYQSKTYKYYHSSFGFGFRQCQPMDCLNVYAVGGTTPEKEGCASSRTLPEVCVPIKAAGTHDPLTDMFKKCQGDTGG